MATVIYPDGRQEPLDLNVLDVFERLRTLQDIIAGPIELLPVAEGRLMLINEDGKRLLLAPNPVATDMVREFLQPGDVIVGKAILCSFDEVNADVPPPITHHKAKDGLTIVGIDRKHEIEAGHIAGALQNLKLLSSTREDCLRYEGTLVLAVDGYEMDPRELAEIPEVRHWFKALDAEWPYWAWFASKSDDTVPLLFSILCGDGSEAISDGYGETGHWGDAAVLIQCEERMLRSAEVLVIRHQIEFKEYQRVCAEFNEVLSNAIDLKEKESDRNECL